MGPFLGVAQQVTYWQYITEIWEDILCTTRRLVFADWLDEHDMHKAARKQREAARIIEQSSVLYWVRAYSQIWGRRKRRLYRIKRDTQIYWHPPYILSVPAYAVRYHRLKGPIV